MEIEISDAVDKATERYHALAAVVNKYDAELKHIFANPGAVTDYTFRGLLMHFFSEMDDTANGH